MNHADVAIRAGIPPADLDSLLNGRAYASVSGKLGVAASNIERYVNSGSASDDLAKSLGVNMLAAEELGKNLDRNGRIGLLVGVMIAR